MMSVSSTPQLLSTHSVDQMRKMNWKVTLGGCSELSQVSGKDCLCSKIITETLPFCGFCGEEQLALNLPQRNLDCGGATQFITKFFVVVVF